MKSLSRAFIALGMLVFVVGTWWMCFRPLPACTIAERAAEAMAEGNYKRYWRLAGPFVREEFDNDRAKYLAYVNELIVPYRHLVDWTVRSAPKDGASGPGCHVTIGTDNELSIVASSTGKNNELISSPGWIATRLYLAQFDLKSGQAKDPVFTFRLLQEYHTANRETYERLDLRFRVSAPAGRTELVDVDTFLLRGARSVERLEAKVREQGQSD